VTVVADTSVLSNFAGAGQLDLLRQLFGALYLPTEVLEEIRDGLQEGYRFYEGLEEQVHPLAEDGWLRLTGLRDEQELRAFGAVPRSLHGGEAACLAIALRRGWVVLTDDRAARGEAERLGLPVSGTVGCLVLAVERGLCSVEQANGWLEAMIAVGYRSPVTDLTTLVRGPGAGRR
jgi:predicted nucleic acid-binding protein